MKLLRSFFNNNKLKIYKTKDGSYFIEENTWFFIPALFLSWIGVIGGTIWWFATTKLGMNPDIIFAIPIAMIAIWCAYYGIIHTTS